MSNNFAPEYIDVATRLVEFREKHPDGSLQPADIASPYQLVSIGGDDFVVVVAAAYRSPDDPRPGIGMAYEPYPGKTPYTRGSELQNAETSAWGRAIMAALAADSRKGIASADEVRNRQADRDAPTTRAPADPRHSMWGDILKRGKQTGLSTQEIRDDYVSWSQGKAIDGADTTPDELVRYFQQMRKPETVGTPA